ncbi:transmembrane protein 199-like isoform X1 [Stylophora pistillata]|nr:transmembrane protein 199-like isoform X1 [Stylophora pistillata]
MAVDVVLTSNIQNTIVDAIKNDHISQDLAEKLSKYTEVSLKKQDSTQADGKVPIPLNLVKQLWKCVREKRDSDLSSNMYLHELLCGSEIYVEQLKLPEKSPELIARLKKLKAKQEKVEYDRMVSNINQKWHQTDGMQFGQEVRSGGKQLSSIVNFLLSIIATFTFGYVASQYAFPSIAVRVIIGVLLAFIVAVAELYFMARVEI